MDLPVESYSLRSKSGAHNGSKACIEWAGFQLEKIQVPANGRFRKGVAIVELAPDQYWRVLALHL